MPIYMQYEGIAGGPRYADFDQLAPDSFALGWTSLPGLPALASSLRSSNPKGINGMLIGLRRQPGYLTIDSKGIIAILIGLLLPAVQKLCEAASSDRRLLAAALSPGGSILFAMGDGSVRPAESSSGAGHPWIEVVGPRLGIVSPRDVATGQATGKRQHLRLR